MSYDTAKFTEFLNGARGITYLMFSRKNETSHVVKLLSKQSIISEDPIYQYIIALEDQGLLETVYALHKPGPPKIREVASLDPIFDTASIYRGWKIFARKDERPYTSNEKEQMRLLFRSVACFLDYFPTYFLWGVKTLGKRSARKMQWRETLKIFFQFCEKLIEVCWEIKNYEIQLNKDYLKWHRIRGDAENYPRIVAFEHMSQGPYRYVYEAYNRKKIIDQHISALANFSQKGRKDIYIKGTLMQELHLLSMALIDPFFASAFFRNIEDIEAVLWEDKLRTINVRALDTAINYMSREESMKITKSVTKMMQEELKVKDMAKRIAIHEATDRFAKEARSYEKSDVTQALRTVIEIANLDMTEQELKRALISFRVCQALEMYIDFHRKDFELKLKDEHVLKLGWEKIT